MHEPSEELDRCAHAVIGAAIEVHRHLGPGFLETVYGEAMAIEMSLRGISFERQFPLAVTYKGHVVSRGHVDLLVEGMLVVELKAVSALVQVHVAQTLSYLKAGAFQLGLLINFHVPILKNGIRRVVSTG
jgi:GxxExxY protein